MPPVLEIKYNSSLQLFLTAAGEEESPEAAILSTPYK